MPRKLWSEKRMMLNFKRNPYIIKMYLGHDFKSVFIFSCYLDQGWKISNVWWTDTRFSSLIPAPAGDVPASSDYMFAPGSKCRTSILSLKASKIRVITVRSMYTCMYIYMYSWDWYNTRGGHLGHHRPIIAKKSGDSSCLQTTFAASKAHGAHLKAKHLQAAWDVVNMLVEYC